MPTRRAADSPAGPDRRRFLGNVVKAAGGLLLGDLAGSPPHRADPRGAGGHVAEIHRLGWPQRTNRSPRSQKQWLQGKGWWPLNAAWIVVWSSEEMIGHVLRRKLLEKRGIETDWKTFVAAGFSNEAFIPGRIHREYGRLGVLALLANKVPMRGRSPFAGADARGDGTRSTRRSRAFPISRARRC